DRLALDDPEVEGVRTPGVYVDHGGAAGGGLRHVLRVVDDPAPRMDRLRRGEVGGRNRQCWEAGAAVEALAAEDVPRAVGGDRDRTDVLAGEGGDGIQARAQVLGYRARSRLNAPEDESSVRRARGERDL